MKKYVNPTLNVETLKSCDVISISLDFLDDFAKDIDMKWEWTPE